MDYAELIERQIAEDIEKHSKHCCCSRFYVERPFLIFGICLFIYVLIMVISFGLRLVKLSPTN